MPAKAHHFFPKFYSKRWAGSDGKLVRYRREPDGQVKPLRRPPTSVGFEDNLYSIPGFPPDLTAQVEERFMKEVDTDADLALQKLIANDTSPWSSRLRSAWTRFIISLPLRHPGAVKSFEKVAAKAYQEARGELGLPQQDDVTPIAIGALSLMMGTIDDEKIGLKLNNIEWFTLDAVPTGVSLLTSDRPAIFNRLGHPGGYLLMPISPEQLFAVGYDADAMRAIQQADGDRLVQFVNETVVAQAEGFVVGHDETHTAMIQASLAAYPQAPFIP